MMGANPSGYCALCFSRRVSGLRKTIVCLVTLSIHGWKAARSTATARYPPICATWERPTQGFSVLCSNAYFFALIHGVVGNFLIRVSLRAFFKLVSVEIVYPYAFPAMIRIPLSNCCCRCVAASHACGARLWF